MINMYIVQMYMSVIIKRYKLSYKFLLIKLKYSESSLIENVVDIRRFHFHPENSTRFRVSEFIQPISINITIVTKRGKTSPDELHILILVFWSACGVMSQHVVINLPDLTAENSVARTCTVLQSVYLERFTEYH